MNWNPYIKARKIAEIVAPLRVRELKLIYYRNNTELYRRTFTGAWIETREDNAIQRRMAVAPLRVRELKLQ